MGPFVMAWLVGETIIVYRSAKTYKTPPGPGQLLLSSGLFALLGLLAESDKARTFATLMAWGVDAAAFMNLFENAPTKIGQAFGSVGQAAATGKVGKWPPSIASNTVVIPNGTNASASSSSSSGSDSGSTKGLPNYNPNLTE